MAGRLPRVGLMNHISLKLGSAVRRRDDAAGMSGWVIGYILSQPTLALVRWDNATTTFEPFDDLDGIREASSI
jgi:hypothetical protein